MGETYLGVVQQVLASPHFDRVYDLVVTDRQLILVYLEMNTPISTLGIMDPPDYQSKSPLVLATQEQNISILFQSVRKVTTEGGPNSNVMVINIRYYDDSGAERKFKIVMFDRVDTVVHIFDEDEGKGPCKLPAHEPQEEVLMLLAKAFPGDILKPDFTDF